MNSPRALLPTAAGLAFAMLALTSPAVAEDYPVRPVRLVIPFPPGGSNDVVGRLIATHLGERLGKQVVVDNRGAGAGGVAGTEVAAHAPHDGCTLLIISIAHAVNPGLPVNSVQELLAMAKEKPGQLQYASAGVGSFQHLGGELFKLMAGVNILHVPFKRGGPAMIDVIGGHT